MRCPGGDWVGMKIPWKCANILDTECDLRRKDGTCCVDEPQEEIECIAHFIIHWIGVIFGETMTVEFDYPKLLREKENTKEMFELMKKIVKDYKKMVENGRKK